MNQTHQPSSESAMVALKASLEQWQQALADPATAQEEVLQLLLAGYARTGYGSQQGADHISSIADYRQAFPITTYADYQPLIQRVMAGETDLLLYEPTLGWAITRGTTKGESKFIPMTPTDLRLRTAAGRAVMYYALNQRRFDVLKGVNLNLNFPSVVGTIKVGDREVDYGYSSGIYVKHVSANTPIRSLPAQDDIDALGGGKTVADWERRFELAYQQCKNKDVTLVGGVAPTALSFARYLRQRHRTYPKDLWQIQVMTLGSVPGINTRHAPSLQALYGEVAIREIYGATEATIGQQRDEKRAWVPNYDLFFLEVETRRGIKMLHEMRPGETGSLILSTPILARYRIGDLIKAYEPPYFRCIGREGLLSHVRYWWDGFTTLEFGRL